MIYPFSSISGSVLNTFPHIDPDTLIKLNKHFLSTEKKYFLSLFVVGGIPKAFNANPLFYEEFRRSISKHLGISPWDIGITGSANIGFSMAPEKWGRPFSAQSDFDVVIISNKLFNKYREDLRLFTAHIKERITKNQVVKKKQLQNLESLVHMSEERGFIDQFRLPCKREYKTVWDSYDLFMHILKRMQKTDGCPKPVKIAARVYRDWDSCVAQLLINFNSAVKKQTERLKGMSGKR